MRTNSDQAETWPRFFNLMPRTLRDAREKLANVVARDKQMYQQPAPASRYRRRAVPDETIDDLVRFFFVFFGGVHLILLVVCGFVFIMAIFFILSYIMAIFSYIIAIY